MRIPMTLIIAAVLTAACTTVKHRPVSGTDMDLDRVSLIQPNESTRAQVDEWFGPPLRVVANKDGSEERDYQYIGFVDRKTEAGVYARNITEKETKLLRLTMRDDVVTRMRYTNTLDPDEDIRKP